MRVTHRTPGSEAFLLEDGDGRILLLNHSTREVSIVEIPARLAGRGGWLAFDGDSVPILAEARAILRTDTNENG